MMVDLAITVLYNGFEGGSIGDPQVYSSSLRSHTIEYCCLSVHLYFKYTTRGFLHSLHSTIDWHSVQYTDLVLIEVPQFIPVHQHSYMYLSAQSSNQRLLQVLLQVLVVSFFSKVSGLVCPFLLFLSLSPLSMEDNVHLWHLTGGLVAMKVEDF